MAIQLFAAKMVPKTGLEPAVQQSRVHLGDVVPAVWVMGTQSITKAVYMHRFHQTYVVPDLALWGRAQH